MVRWLRRLIAVVVVLVLVVFIASIFLLRGSLPHLDGEIALGDLASPVTVTRDALGAVTVDAKSGDDAWRALGYVHAQERYFEMDLMRRLAAGELAELFGAIARDTDRGKRLHRFRARATTALASIPAEQRQRLDAYVAGVNAGLAALSVRPFPYLLLRQQPAAWSASDSALVAYAMFLDLQDEANAKELAFARMRAVLPAAYFALLDARGSEWDAPLTGDAWAPPPLPDAGVVDIHALPRELFGRGAAVAGDIGVGSNNFGVAGALTTTGAALVANDMHLGLRVPNIWFRARIRYDDGVDVSGVSLPGLPGIVAGSNTHVAWGYTNSYGDWLDWVQVHWLDAAHTRYRTRDGEATVETHDEVIRVHGAPDETLRVRETIFGPIVVDDATPTTLALAWTAHRPGALNFDLIAMDRARTVDDALAIVQRAGMPAQNLLVGDREGRLAWTIAGRIPNRIGYDGTAPADWSQPGIGWDGWLAPEHYPQVVDPASHRIWTANARVVDGDAYARIGAGEYALGARARQIRDDLFARDRFAPTDLLAIQLDDRTLFQQRWWQLLRDTLAKAPGDAALTELASVTATWDERASTDAVAYRMARAFRIHVHTIVADSLAAPMRQHDVAFVMPGLSQSEGIVWAMLQQKPMNLLSPHYADWDALLLDCAHRTANDFAGQPGGLAQRTWGERNRSRIRHPLSGAVPFLSRWLDMPSRELAGDSAMPRVQGPSFGASERFAVSPGHEAGGYLHMPGGQSGHPFSPYYGAGHSDWEEGKATPFLPGAAEHTLTFSPAR